MSSRRKATYAAKIESNRTSQKHKVEKTICYRMVEGVCVCYQCYTIVLGK